MADTLFSILSERSWNNWPNNPDPYKVLLRSLGRELSTVQAPVAAGTPSPSDGSVFYAETGHWLDGQFVDAWTTGGGLGSIWLPDWGVLYGRR